MGRLFGPSENYYLYAAPPSGKFHFIPWGADNTFRIGNPFRPHETPESVQAEGILAQRLYNLPLTREKYRARMQELLDTVWDETSLLAEIDRVELLIKGHLHISESAFQEDLDSVRHFIQSRREAIQAELDEEAYAPDFPLKESPFRPVCGTVVGNINAIWPEKSENRSYEHGKAEFLVTLNGEVEQFTQVGVQLEKSSNNKPHMDVWGMQADIQRPVVMSLTFEPENFVADATLQLTDI